MCEHVLVTNEIANDIGPIKNKLVFKLFFRIMLLLKEWNSPHQFIYLRPLRV